MSTTHTTGHNATATTAEVDGLSTDDLHHLLSNERRRTILTILDDADRPLDKGALADRLAARETGKPIEAVDHKERKRAMVAIYQTHLPKLRDYDAIRESRDGYVLGPTAGALLPYCTDERGWFSRAVGFVAARV